MNLTLKNIPEPLYRRLKEIAARNRRSLNSEVIHRLERSIRPRRAGWPARSCPNFASGPTSST